MDNNKIKERQEHYITEYQKIYSEIQSLENQILGMVTKMKNLEERLEELRNQEKTEFEYGKEN